jgi:hypothetical protein
LVINFEALIGFIEYETLPQKHPGCQEPHQVKDHEGLELIAVFATHSVNQLLQRCEFELIFTLRAFKRAWRAPIVVVVLTEQGILVRFFQRVVCHLIFAELTILN